MALSLYFASEGFKVEGEPWPGIPLFVRHESMRIEYFPTEWMYSKVVVSDEL
ncbi:MAG TPA: hypothetical protein VKT72_14550 [Candidatus Baltobacteraceae bacterium]|nr:hypothetical protein [Candidatus Baltobacteraceae bacterium]